MTFTFLLTLVRPYRSGLVVLMAIQIAQSAVSLVVPLVGGLLGAKFLGGDSTDFGASSLAAAAVGLLAAAAGLQILSALLYARVSQEILANLRTRLFDRLLGLPLPWHQARNRGDVMAVLTLESESLGQFLTETLVSLPPLLLTSFGACILMWRIDPSLTYLVPVLVPAFYIAVRVMGRLLRGLAHRIQEEHAQAVSLFEEMLDLLPAIKSFTTEPRERRNFADQIETLRGLSLREDRVYAFVDPLTGFVVSAATVVLLFMVGRNLQEGNLSPAETISFLLYVALLVRPVSQLAGVYGQFQTAKGALARLQDVLSEPPEPEAAGTPPPRVRGDIQFEGVTFAFPGRTAAVNDLSLHIRPGETVALTGPNGAGKTTAISLLLRFYVPEQGRILLDGQDIADMPLDHLRGVIGHVPQSRHMRDASLAENIAFGQDGVTQQAIEAAAKIAQAHEFIIAMPQGYDTQIGDKGIRLSGGQQQRVALARALVKDPAILILDEATSMFDVAGEADFVADCRAALAGRTVILITHRPASLALADRTLLMEAGHIVPEAGAV